jgi:hypothetical protein
MNYRRHVPTVWYYRLLATTSDSNAAHHQFCRLTFLWSILGQFMQSNTRVGLCGDKTGGKARRITKGGKAGEWRCESENLLTSGGEKGKVRGVFPYSFRLYAYDRICVSLFHTQRRCCYTVPPDVWEISFLQNTITLALLRRLLQYHFFRNLLSASILFWS